MTAINTDKLKKLSRKWVGQVGSAGVSDAVVTTIQLSSTTNLATDTAVIVTIDRIDSNGTKTAALEESIIGIVSGSNLVSCVRGAEGTAQAHAAGAVVEILVTAKGWNDMVDHLLVEHTQLGVHTSALVTSLKATGAVVTTGTSDITIVTPKALTDAGLNITASSTTTFTNKTISTGCALDANASANFTYNSLFRQGLINGNFDLWQRGTTFNNTGASVVYYPDRWTFFNNSATNANTDITKQTITAGDLDGSTYSIRIQRKASATYASTMYFGQALESSESKKFIGKKVTLSFWLKVGADWTGGDIHGYIYSGTGTDQQYSAGFTNAAIIGTVTLTPSATYTKYTVTTTNVVADAVTQLGIQFETHAFSGTAGAADYFEVAQCQLCAGDVALPFIAKSIQQEQDDCNRFCQSYVTLATYESLFHGSAGSTTIAYVTVKLKRTMRTTPTLTATAADWQVTPSGAVGVDLSALAITADFFGPNGGFLTATVAAGLTANIPYDLNGDGNAGRILIFSAEL